MEKSDILKIANRLKSEGRAISPVSVCLEAYGQALPDIAETLQQWRGERLVSMDATREEPPMPSDLRGVMQDAIERFWSAAQQGMRAQVDDEFRALRERAQDAERETGMLYMDLTRALSEVESCKRKIWNLQHGVAQRDAQFEDVGDRAPQRQLANGQNEPQSQAPPNRAETENGMSGVAYDRPTYNGTPLASDAASSSDADELASRLASAETKVEELEAKLAAAQETSDQQLLAASASNAEQAHAEASKRIADLEAAFARERRMLQGRLEECALQTLHWKQEADQLKNTMEPLRQHSEWLNGQTVAHNAILNRLLEELRKVDPGNELLHEDVRQEIIAEATSNSDT